MNNINTHGILPLNDVQIDFKNIHVEKKYLQNPFKNMPEKLSKEWYSHVISFGLGSGYESTMLLALSIKMLMLFLKVEYLNTNKEELLSVYNTQLCPQYEKWISFVEDTYVIKPVPPALSPLWQIF